jgi:glycosyltransferase involved in cell wall biosynthesis
MPLQTVQLLSDRKTRLALGAAGRKYLLETFNWKIYAARLNALYCSSGTAAGSHNGSKSDD